jgi:hypothetical protein
MTDFFPWTSWKILRTSKGFANHKLGTTAVGYMKLSVGVCMLVYS